jgi:hypothetical protein
MKMSPFERVKPLLFAALIGQRHDLADARLLAWSLLENGEV